MPAAQGRLGAVQLVSHRLCESSRQQPVACVDLSAAIAAVQSSATSLRSLPLALPTMPSSVANILIPLPTADSVLLANGDSSPSSALPEPFADQLTQALQDRLQTIIPPRTVAPDGRHHQTWETPPVIPASVSIPPVLTAAIDPQQTTTAQPATFTAPPHPLLPLDPPIYVCTATEHAGPCVETPAKTGDEQPTADPVEQVSQTPIPRTVPASVLPAQTTGSPAASQALPTAKPVTPVDSSITEDGLSSDPLPLPGQLQTQAFEVTVATPEHISIPRTKDTDRPQQPVASSDPAPSPDDEPETHADHRTDPITAATEFAATILVRADLPEQLPEEITETATAAPSPEPTAAASQPAPADVVPQPQVVLLPIATPVLVQNPQFTTVSVTAPEDPESAQQLIATILANTSSATPQDVTGFNSQSLQNSPSLVRARIVSSVATQRDAPEAPASTATFRLPGNINVTAQVDVITPQTKVAIPQPPAAAAAPAPTPEPAATISHSVPAGTATDQPRPNTPVVALPQTVDSLNSATPAIVDPRSSDARPVAGTNRFGSASETPAADRAPAHTPPARPVSAETPPDDAALPEPPDSAEDQKSSEPGFDTSPARDVPQVAADTTSEVEDLVTPGSTARPPAAPGEPSPPALAAAPAVESPAATTPTAPPTPSHPVPVTGQIASSVAAHVRSWQEAGEPVRHIAVRLDPPELGALRIQVRSTDDGLHMHVEAAEDVTLEMLTTRVPEIEQLLKHQEIEIHRVTIQRMESSVSDSSTSDRSDSPAREQDLSGDSEHRGRQDHGTQQQRPRHTNHRNSRTSPGRTGNQGIRA